MNIRDIRKKLTDYGIDVVECYIEQSQETINDISRGDAFVDESGNVILDVLLAQDFRGESDEWQAMKNHVASGVYMTQANVAAKVIRLVTEEADKVEAYLLKYIDQKAGEAWFQGFWLGLSTAGIVLSSILLLLFMLIRL